ncbi:sigma 54-interacting transcriptional regulator [Planomicrobium sp. CPCC 101110]|uniref:sigma 54-interacting transcriptional regulator n=1 Tax=Planomicrobium sp. CPCC 101110 TaxID=2599619 RepID=UPI00351BCD9B
MEVANHGTLFFDKIEKLSLRTQAKRLQVQRYYRNFLSNYAIYYGRVRKYKK